MRVLLIDPVVERRQHVAQALQRQGFDVAAFEEPAAACAAQGAEFRPLAILAADCWDEAIQGCRRLRGESADRALWVLALAGQCAANRVEDLLAAGADDVLPLPLEDRNLEVRLAVAKQRIRSSRGGKPLGEYRRAEVVGKDAESACPRSDPQFLGLIENMPDLVAILDADGILRFLNRAPPLLSREEMLGTRCTEYLAPRHVQPLLRAIQRALDTRTVQVIPVADNQGRWWEARLVPIGQPETRDRVLAICTDMTERQRAVDLLRASEQRYRLIAENVGELIWCAEYEAPVVLPDRLGPDEALALAAALLERWQFTYVSPSVQRMLGYDVHEFMDMGLKQLLTAASYASVQQAVAEELVMETTPGSDPRRSRVFPIEQFAKDGQVRYCEATASVLRNAEGRVTGVLGVTRDLTERRAAEIALRESEATLRGLLRNMPDLVVVVDQNAAIEYVNRSVAGVSPIEMVGRLGLWFAKPEHHEPFCQAMQKAWEIQQVQHLEVIDLSDQCWSCRVVPILEPEKIFGAMVICTDVTEKKRADAAVQKEQDLLRQMLELFERDRELVAFEIHDGVAQQLTGSLLNFEASAPLAATAPAQAERTYREGLRLLREGIEESRRLIGGLRPPVLDAFGIVPAIEHLIQENSAAGGPEIELIAAEQIERLARPLENAVFRIVQESLTNARRHSQSKKVRVELHCAVGRIHFSVHDWGIGFDPKRVRPEAFGLRGIRERARLLGGSALIQTSLGQGTCVTVDLPLLLGTPRQGGDDLPEKGP